MEQKLPGTLLAITCAQLGRKDEAIHLLQEEYERHSAALLTIRQNPDLLTMSNEPAYQDLLRKIHAPKPPKSAE
jgi:hypothetical protein